MGCSQSVLKAELTWLHPGVAFEHTAEIKSVFISHQFSDLLDFHIQFVDEQPFGLIHPQLCQIFRGRFTGIFLKDLAQIFRCKSELFTKLLKGNLLLVIFQQIFLDKLAERLRAQCGVLRIVDIQFVRFIFHLDQNFL